MTKPQKSAPDGPRREREPKPSGAANPSKSRSARENRACAPGLYVVSTPIGNAQDVTLRALELLRTADALIVEDSRVTARLLAIHGITRSLIVYNDHAGERERNAILARLKSGACLALVSDAGTPLVSDPGFKLVRAAIAKNIPVHVLPGASAALSALVLSGLPPDRFMVCGFLPAKGGQRRAALRELASVPATLIFYEAPQRISETLSDMQAVLGDREAVVAREMTKLHEDTRRGLFSELIAHFANGDVKGEITIVIAPPSPEKAAEPALDERLATRLKEESLKEAVAGVAAETGLPRKTVYARALKLAKRSNDA